MGFRDFGGRRFGCSGHEPHEPHTAPTLMRVGILATPSLGILATPTLGTLAALTLVPTPHRLVPEHSKRVDRRGS